MGIKEYDELHSGHISHQSDIFMCVHPVPKDCISEMNGHIEENKKFRPLDSQVAGHMDDGKNLDMLVSGDKIYKPIIKSDCGERETDFYKKLFNTTSSHPCSTFLRELVAEYYGNEHVTIRNKSVECIVLENLTRNYKEPCVIDIKIGKRTWDPLATPTKIRKEDSKYRKTKSTLGFCVTGFQYYDVRTGKLVKRLKDYCKNLDENSVKKDFRNFLNGNATLSRALLIQILAKLWRIQQWGRTQTYYRLYSSSLLLIYDARRLRKCLQESGSLVLNPNTPNRKLSRSSSLYRPVSVATLNDPDKVSTGFSGQCTRDGPNLHVSSNTKPFDFSKDDEVPKRKQVSTLKRTHSHNNNFDNDLSDLRKGYTDMLDDLMHENFNALWTNVKMIDFAHTFESDQASLDSNYLNGLNNLIAIFEEFLDEAT